MMFAEVGLKIFNERIDAKVQTSYYGLRAGRVSSFCTPPLPSQQLCNNIHPLSTISIIIHHIEIVGKKYGIALPQALLKKGEEQVQVRIKY
jgi:hypothetical protein